MLESGNSYISLDEFKLAANVSDTTKDALYLTLCESASRMIDTICHRRFYLWKGVRYYTAKNYHRVLVDDIFTLTELASDPAGDSSYSEVWTASQYGRVQSSWPIQAIVFNDDSPSISLDDDYFRVTGVFGYAKPSCWRDIVATATIATTGGKTIEVSSYGNISVGNTILVDSEQMYVTAKSTTTGPTKYYLTVERGVNGTTAATHSSKAVATMQYVELASAATLHRAKLLLRQIECAGISDSMIGNIRNMMFDPKRMDTIDHQLLGGLIRVWH